MMLRTTTTKCPCGYVHKIEENIETRIIPASNVITCKPGRRPVIHDKPTKRASIVKTTTLEGKKEFKRIQIITHYNKKTGEEDKMILLVCPKCGSVLYPEFARIVREKEK